MLKISFANGEDEKLNATRMQSKRRNMEGKIKYQISNYES